MSKNFEKKHVLARAVVAVDRPMTYREIFEKNLNQNSGFEKQTKK